MVSTKAVGFIQAAMEDDWKAAAWFLERKLSDEWGRKDRRQEIDLTVREGDERPLHELLTEAQKNMREQLGEEVEE